MASPGPKAIGLGDGSGAGAERFREFEDIKTCPGVHEGDDGAVMRGGESNQFERRAAARPARTSTNESLEVVTTFDSVARPWTSSAPGSSSRYCLRIAELSR